MSERTLKQLVGALVVVVAVWVVASLLSGRGGAPGASGELAGFLNGVTPEAVTAVRMVGPDDSIELRPDGERWSVNGYAADSANVARFWSDLAESSVGGLVASNPANHARMGVTADSASRLEIDVGGRTRVLLVGKQGGRYGTAYVRLPDEDAVHVFEGNVRPHVVRGLSEWRDKRVVAVDTAAVRRLEVTRDGATYALVRADSTWTFDGGGATSATDVRSILSELRDFRATDFLEESDSIAMLDESAGLVALGANGDTLAAVTLGGGSGDRWVRARGNPVLYSITSYRVDRIAPTRERVTGS